MKAQYQLIEIPQVDVTFEVLGSRLYWCWVFEHGVNEFWNGYRECRGTLKGAV